MKTNGNCKAVRCLTNGKFYHSLKDAARENGVTCSSVSYAIKHGTPCKGKKYGFESEMEANVMALASNLSERETEMEMLRAKANAYDLLMAEQKAKEEAEAKRLEAERKAKEEREQKIAKLEGKLARYDDLIDRAEQRKQKLISEMASVAFELKALREMEV